MDYHLDKSTNPVPYYGVKGWDSWLDLRNLIESWRKLLFVVDRGLWMRMRL